jgi:dolichol-phosphate mannosyltransferase
MPGEMVAASSLPSAEAPQLSVLMPAYGEAENLRLLLPKIQQVLSELGLTAEICVVDATPSVDDTQQVCQEAQVTYLPRQGGNRYGDAVRTGFKHAAGEYVITMDSDGSHNPEFIKELWSQHANADVVIASRYAPGGTTDNPWALVAMSRVLNVTFKLFVGMPVYDISNSFRLYRGKLVRNLQLNYNNFDILEETLVRLIWDNPAGPANIIEMPFHFEQRKHGKPKRKLVVFALQFFVALFKLQKIRFQSLGKGQ